MRVLTPDDNIESDLDMTEEAKDHAGNMDMTM